MPVMKNLPFPPAVYIDHDDKLQKLSAELSAETLIAVDTESNSLYAYQERVCLIQISTRTQDYIIDPLAINDMSPLGEVFANPQVEKVFHAAEYDLICMKRDFDFTLNHIFDTMMAARICGHKAIGLGVLLETHFGIKLDKSHQRDNWGHRPLPKGSLHYAQMDTHFLPKLRDILYEELCQLGHISEAEEVFAEACRFTPYIRRQFDPDGYWAIGTPANLTRRQMAILREMYLLREQLAQARNVPPFKVFSNRTLVQIAEKEPATFSQLKPLDGMSVGQIRRYGRQILRAVERGRANRLPSPPQLNRPAPVVMERYGALHLWRKTRAEQRGVEADVILSKQAMWELAQHAPSSSEDLQGLQVLGPWRIATYGTELLNLIATFSKNGE